VARGSGSPDFTNSDAPVAKSTRLWVWRDQRVMPDLPGAKAGLEGALGCARGSGGGSARRRMPACGVSASGTGQSLRHLAQKDQGDVLKLTEGLVRAGWPCRGVGDVDRRRRQDDARVEGCCRGSPAPRLHGSARSGAVKVLRGLRRMGTRRRRGIKVAEQTHRRQSSVKSRRYMGRGCGGRAWGASWRWGEADAGPRPGLGCSRAAGPRWSSELGAAEQGGQRLTVWGGGGDVGDKGAGDLGILFVGRRGTLGMGARSRDSPEIVGSRCAAGDAGEEERNGERGRRQVGSAGQREGGRDRTEEAGQRTGPSVGELVGRGNGEGKERERNKPRGGRTGPRGKRGADWVGVQLGLLSYLLPFFFSNQLKSI
jgi:hypothetical protein